MEIKTSKEWIEKINKLKEKVVDLSADEDLTLAIMNLISMEEHLYFTAEKTGKDEYFDLLNQVREIRKKMMERLVGKPEGELWCFIKHTLSTSMRFIEVGTKLQNQNKKDEAKEVFDLAYELFNIFWGIKLNIIPADERGLQRGLTPPQINADYNTDERGYLIDESGSEINKDQRLSALNQSKSAWLKNLIEKIVNCCTE